jgi:preprotein translocase subunit SecF
VDALFVTALLTVLGFSIHDTIVVFDRIREGLKDRAKKSFREIINTSINATLNFIPIKSFFFSILGTFTE